LIKSLKNVAKNLIDKFYDSWDFSKENYRPPNKRMVKSWQTLIINKQQQINSL